MKFQKIKISPADFFLCLIQNKKSFSFILFNYENLKQVLLKFCTSFKSLKGEDLFSSQKTDGDLQDKFSKCVEILPLIFITNSFENSKDVSFG